MRLSPKSLALVGLVSGGLVAATVLTANYVKADAPATWTRQMGVRLTQWPEGDIVGVQVRVEIPKEYAIASAPTTTLPTAGGEVNLRLLSAEHEDHLVILDAYYDEPIELQPYLFKMALTMDRPDGLDRPIRLKRLKFILRNGDVSNTASGDVIIQSHPSGVYEDLQ